MPHSKDLKEIKLETARIQEENKKLLQVTQGLHRIIKQLSASVKLYTQQIKK
jgi:hypothetical protein